MLSAIHLQDEVIAPALDKLDLWSRASEELVLGTAIIESSLKWLKQHGDGPALGLWQIEPATHQDLYENYLQYRPELMQKLEGLLAPDLSMDENLQTNLMYGAGVCRLCYYRKPDPIPIAGDLEGQAHYWKDHYNTHLGAGTVSKYTLKVKQVFDQELS